MLPIVHSLESHAKNSPNRAAVITGDHSTTYAQLWHQVIVAAEWYIDKGVKLGDTVIISTDSRDPYYPAAYFGAHLARAVAVPTEFRASRDEIKQRMEFVGSKLTMFGDRLLEFRAALQKSGGSILRDADSDFPSLSELAEIMFTTGSTGRPKGVTLSHRNIAASTELIHKFVANRPDDKEVVTVPLTHSFGLGRLRSTILVGGTVVLVPGLTFPQLTIRALEDHQATGLSCVPSGVHLLMSQFEEKLAELADQLRFMEMGSAPMSVSDKNKLCTILPNTRLCMHYGLTEASRSTFLELHADRDHLESVGRPSPGVETRIVSQSKSRASIGERGFIQVRAETVMQGYWDDDTRTNGVLDRTTGWLNTGDLGYADANGYIHFAGRADDAINTGGENILPDDVEHYANEFNGVDECGCIGIPDPDGILGEVPLLFVVSGSTELDLNELSVFLHQRIGREAPNIIIKSIGRLPRSASGKLLRRELRSKFDNEQTRSK